MRHHVLVREFMTRISSGYFLAGINSRLPASFTRASWRIPRCLPASVFGPVAIINFPGATPKIPNDPLNLDLPCIWKLGPAFHQLSRLSITSEPPRAIMPGSGLNPEQGPTAFDDVFFHKPKFRVVFIHIIFCHAFR